MDDELLKLKQELRKFKPDLEKNIIYIDIPDLLMRTFRIISNEYEINILSEITNYENGEIHLKIKDHPLKTIEVLKRTTGAI